MEETLNMTLTSESLQHKVLLRKLEFGLNCKGLVCTKETRKSAFIYHLCTIFCCFLKYKFNHNLVDRISDLPDEILDNILSFLPLKEAVATSVLSRRWHYVWTSTMNLDFDVDKVLPFSIDLKPKSLDRKSHRYADWVDRIVERHIGHNIKKFRACFALDCRFASSIDEWIQFAMKKRVEVLVLDIIKLQGFCYKDLYSFPTKLLGLKKGPALDNCSGFKSLKVLYLQNVDVTDEVVEYFLSHCPVLERLSVILAKSLANVRVIGPSVRLKYLELKLVYDLTMVQVCDTDLVSLVHVGYCDVELILSNVPFLVEVSVVGDLHKNPNGLRPAFTQISCCLSQLESLMVDLNFVEYNENYVFPVLENLKNLELSVEADYEWGLSHLSSFMKASPSLQRLVLKMGYEECERKKIKKAARVPHCNLRLVEVEGYRGRVNVDAHVMYLVENAVELQKIVIDPLFKWLVHHTRADMGRIDLKKEAKVLTVAKLLILEHQVGKEAAVRSCYELSSYAFPATAAVPLDHVFSFKSANVPTTSCADFTWKNSSKRQLTLSADAPIDGNQASEEILNILNLGVLMGWILTSNYYAFIF